MGSELAVSWPLWVKCGETPTRAVLPARNFVMAESPSV